MRIVVNVATVEDVPAARDAAEATMREGDELEIVVGSAAPPSAKPAESQPMRQATGYPVSPR